ncbi:hypothetical protein [Xanthomonas arboricola]|uniref:Uncharacterized protein n=1 Tax=Xanthomonas arboricola pv. corylina TaxID=487821 RepID=A0A8D6VJ58_9XANT|nr:hypothetical protein [Xanthomonas arboricola]CAE6818546.1 hypothetical protein CFBP1159_33010 [Xanthomonas arboricola pv. corylina]CAE6818565.1 hypothetical protein CFBP1159_33010 [Xanthomonas arboricola pv. corylina]
MTDPQISDTPHAPQLSTELELMLRESDLAVMKTSRCLQCAHSTVLQLAYPPEEPLPGKQPDTEPLRHSDMVVYCGAMNRDITAPVKRCTSFIAKL